jgi:protein ImuB
VHLPLLPSERIRARTPAPPDGPFALVEKVKSAVRLAALDAKALALGLEPGLTLADARARVPGLAVFDHDPAADRALLDWLVEACGRYTPSVMADPPSGLILDIAGCTHFFAGNSRRHPELVSGSMVQRTPPSRANAWMLKQVQHDGSAVEKLAHDLHARLNRLSLTARLALGDTPDAAAALARFGGDDVGALPVTALRVDSETHTALRRAGLKTIAALASRPRAALAARFGRALPELLDRLLGLSDKHITPRVTPDAVQAEARFAEPIARTEDVLETVARLVGETAIELGRRGTGGRRFAIALYRSDGHVARLAVETGAPTRDPKLVDRLLRERIDALADPLDPGFGYDLVRLVVPVTEALSPAQLRLEGGTLADDEFAALIDRLVARLGRHAVRRFASAHTHIPEQASFTLPAGDAPPLVLTAPEPGEPPLRPIHLFDPPQRIEVLAEVPDGPPRRFRWRRSTHEITRSEGPERIAAEWWRRKDGAGPTRDYYRIEDARGRRFWVFRHGLYGTEKANPDWYVHGLFA